MHTPAHKSSRPHEDVPDGPEPGALPVEPDAGVPQPFTPAPPGEDAPQPLP
ncbi:MAG: hypothetical protein H7172_05080 [Ferruginibacter sp.]|nr:hypothetical protein [Rhodoferax sp.]